MFGRKHQVVSRPAPIGGVNARDAISIMPETDAINLVNWIPDAFGVRCRKGYKEWATPFPEGEVVKSVFAYITETTVIPAGGFLSDPSAMPGKLWAATDSAIYDITDRGAPVLEFALQEAANSGWFSTTQLSNTAGTFLAACSEADGYHLYDGSDWQRVPGAGPDPHIAGAEPNDFVQCMLFKKRLWFVERESTSAWYLPTDQVTGTVSEFDFGSQFKSGGHLSYLANWTIDAGEGIDDFLVAVSSMGDVVIYKGVDPATAATFNLVGVWNVGQIPVGRRGFTQYGGDLVILSAQGVLPVSSITRGGSSLLQATEKEYSTPIRAALGRDISASFSIQGWQLMVHPNERLMLCNVPDYAAVRDKQYAMSTTLNNWTILADIPTTCYGASAGYIFSGTADGRVLILFVGAYDNVPVDDSTLGDGIRGVVQSAFSYFGSPANSKHFHMVRPSFLSVLPPQVLVDMAVNFSTVTPEGAPTFDLVAAALWDSGIWDTSVWGGDIQSFSEWVSVLGVGFSGAANLVTVTPGDTVLVSIDYMYSNGGPF